MENPNERLGPPVDMDFIQEMTGGDPGFLREFFSTFLADVSTRLPQIEQAMRPFNGPEVRLQVHSFVGTATCLGAMRLHATAQKLEGRALAQDLTEAQGAYSSFRSELLRTAEFVRTQLESLEG